MGAISGWMAEQNQVYLREGVAHMHEPLHTRDPRPAARFESPGVVMQCPQTDGSRVSLDLRAEAAPAPADDRLPAPAYLAALDGALDNRAELLQALRDTPPLADESDPGLLLRAYIKWGMNFPGKLLGAFAAALYDPRQNRLILVRDALGAKPLFYARLGDGLSFASELKGLLKAPGQAARLEPDGLCSLLALGPARPPHCSIFAGTQALAPGHTLVFDGRTFRVRRYWNVEAAAYPHGPETAFADLMTLLRDSVGRMPANAGLLSGGLDSTLVCALVREADPGAEIRTFSVEYEDNDSFTPTAYQPGDDRAFIGPASKALRTEHEKVVLTPESLADALLEAMRARDMPGMADVDSSLLLFCREVRDRGATRVLSGECADELLGGYPWYHRADLFGLDTFPWSYDWTLRLGLLKPGINELLGLEGYAHRKYRECVEDAPLLKGETAEQSHRRQLFHLCREYFMQTLLERGDRMGTRAGVEILMPFCDPRLAAYAYNLPWEILAWNGREKGALRKAAEGLLPEDILWRKKSPFPKTVSPRYANAVAELAREAMEKGSSPLWEIVDKERVRGWIENPVSDAPPWYGQLMGLPQMLGMIVQMAAWFEEYRVGVPM